MPAKRKHPITTETEVDAPLSPKEELFVYELLQRGVRSGSDAAIAAGYAVKSARVQASRMLTRANIQRAIRERLDAAQIEADDVLRRLVEHATGSMADFIAIDKDGLPGLDFRQARKLGKLGLVKKFKHTREVRGSGDDMTTKDTYEVELYDAQAALTLLGKHHRLFDRAGEDDWRGELIRAGLDPDEALENLANDFFAHLQPGAGSADSGSLGEGESARRSGA